ncbi:MAG: accessory regulator AgrB [Clostridiales bacterium GWC2_40_7]|nr:MAG: accessory regulator AgrB [Clostridiales bacterium GWC2_40_7]
MRFVNKLSYSCAGRLAAAMNENHQKRSVYYFSFQIIFGGIAKNIVLISLALLFGVLLPALISAAVFAAIRLLAGGYHMDTYGKCLFVSISMFMLAALTAQYTYQYWNYFSLGVLIAITLIYGLYSLIRYAPKDTPHKPITDTREIKKFKLLSIVCLIVLIISASILAYFNLNIFTLSICFGSILELFTVTSLGNNFFDMVRNGITHKRAKVV